MKNDMFLFALCLSACFSKATTNAESVWLKDVTKRLQTDKRGDTSTDFPDQLSFHLKRKTHDLVLNLEKNYLIDPNIDTYVVKRIMDGQPLLEKIQNLEQADVAYYQDIDNGAFMTARCAKRSSGQCDILINGNIRLGDRSYNLRQSEADAVQNDFLEIMGLRGKRYILEDQTHIRSGMSAENNARPNVAPLQKIFPTGAINYGRTTTKNDKARQVNDYYVDVVTIADYGLWLFFYKLAASTGDPDTHKRATIDLREYMVHVVHGVHQLYSEIEDASMSITVRIKYMVIYERDEFDHKHSTVQNHEGKQKIDGDKYLKDLKHWDFRVGSINFPADYDQVMLFTKYWLYSGDLDDTKVDGRSNYRGVCDLRERVQIVRVSDFFYTIRTAAHGLGHALGAHHDRHLPGYRCLAKDNLIMSHLEPKFYKDKKYTLNPWLFSNCSVEAMKSTLPNKQCVKTSFLHHQETIDAFERILRIPTGQRFDANTQCVLRNGIESELSRTTLKHICSAMTCKDPVTQRFDGVYLAAASGTVCGDNKTCQKGLCVATPQKLVFTHKQVI